MAILLDDCMCYAVIRAAALEEKYPGGVRGFLLTVCARSCTDGNLVVIDTMSMMDTSIAIGELRRYGIQPMSDVGGNPDQCSWLTIESVHVGWLGSNSLATLAYLTGSDTDFRFIESCSGTLSADGVISTYGQEQIKIQAERQELRRLDELKELERFMGTWTSDDGLETITLVGRENASNGTYTRTSPAGNEQGDFFLRLTPKAYLVFNPNTPDQKESSCVLKWSGDKCLEIGKQKTGYRLFRQI